MKTVACLHRYNATHCIVLAVKGWGGEEGGSWGVGGWVVFPVGVIPVNNSSNIPLETLWHYSCPRFAGRIPTSTKTKGLSPGVFWEFSASPLGMIQRQGKKRKNNNFMFSQVCIDSSKWGQNILRLLDSHFSTPKCVAALTVCWYKF